MGVDISAVAAWGIKTTYGQAKKTYTKNRTWIGRLDGDRSFEFDPRTGKPNYEEEEEAPEEIENWEFFNLGAYDARDSDECIIAFTATHTPSHRDELTAAKIPEKPADDDSWVVRGDDDDDDAAELKFSDFRDDMTKLGLWDKKKFGLWLFLNVG